MPIQVSVATYPIDRFTNKGLHVVICAILKISELSENEAMKTVDVYWSFRSPYSYLATPGLRAIAQEFTVTTHLRVVWPIAVRAPDTLFSEQSLQRVRYILLDWPRRAEFLDMPAHWPNPDPITQDLATMKIATEQPLIRRLSFLGVEAQRRGRGVAFAYEVSHLLFGGQENWHEGEHLAKAAARAELDLADMQRAINATSHAQDIEDNQQALALAGHWGVPTCVYNGQPYFGQDRLDTLRWQLTKDGLSRS